MLVFTPCHIAYTVCCNQNRGKPLNIQQYYIHTWSFIFLSCATHTRNCPIEFFAYYISYDMYDILLKSYFLILICHLTCFIFLTYFLTALVSRVSSLGLSLQWVNNSSLLAKMQVAISHSELTY